MIFLGRLVFVYFKRIYFWISRPNLPTEESEGDIFSKAADCKPLFLLNVKIKQNHAIQITDNAIFEHNYFINIARFFSVKVKTQNYLLIFAS